MTQFVDDEETSENCLAIEHAVANIKSFGNAPTVELYFKEKMTVPPNH